VQRKSFILVSSIPVYSFRVLAAVKNSALYCTPFSQFRSIEMQLLNRNYCSTSKLCSTYSICLFFSMHNNLGYTANRDVGDLHFKSFNLRHEMSQVTEFSHFIPLKPYTPDAIMQCGAIFRFSTVEIL
jgi:hypothetical protein